ncbi:CBS domain-containing protein [Micromonosporaceae bacterium Da 78-11]
MKLWRVNDVMTKEVVAVQQDTPYRDVVDLLIGRRVSAVPVLDRFEHVVGVVSEADLLHKVEAVGAPEPRIFDAWRRRGDRAKAGGRTAGEIMTSPAVVVPPSLSVAAAARRMQNEQVKRFPVVDDLGRLVGVVTRGDLLKMHLRSDAEIENDVVEELRHQHPHPEPGRVWVETAGGVVRLIGRVHLRSMAEAAKSQVNQVPGVVGVIDELTYDLDDRMAVGSETGIVFGVA